jgi:hypothetical protein
MRNRIRVLLLATLVLALALTPSLAPTAAVANEMGPLHECPEPGACCYSGSCSSGGSGGRLCWYYWVSDGGYGYWETRCN